MTFHGEIVDVPFMFSVMAELSVAQLPLDRGAVEELRLSLPLLSPIRLTGFTRTRRSDDLELVLRRRGDNPTCVQVPFGLDAYDRDGPLELT